MCHQPLLNHDQLRSTCIHLLCYSKNDSHIFALELATTNCYKSQYHQQLTAWPSRREPGSEPETKGGAWDGGTARERHGLAWNGPDETPSSAIQFDGGNATQNSSTQRLKKHLTPSSMEWAQRCCYAFKHWKWTCVSRCTKYRQNLIIDREN